MNKAKAFGLAAFAAAASFLGFKASEGSPTPPRIVTTLLKLGITGQPYSMPLIAMSGRTPYRWSVTGLPFGLSVSGSNITGTLSQSFEGSVTLTVRDKTNKTATVTLPLAVCKPLVILNPPTHPIETGKSYQFYFDGGPLSANPPKCVPPQTNPL